MVIPLVAGVLALATPPLAQPVDPHLLWQLGKRDSTYAEFAVAGNYGAYAARFKRDPVARIGTQSPEQQWPFIHPGPGDAWAGSRAHRFRIEFTAGDIRGPVCRLTIGMVNTHNAAAPVLVVSINGRTQYRYDLPTGAPDASLTDPKQGRPTSLAIPFPAGLLRRGRNAIELSVVSGSWLLYDYLALEDGLDAPRGPVLTDLNATSTMLFRRTRGGIRQVVEVLVNNQGVEGSASASIEGSAPAGRVVKLAPGRNRFEIHVRPVAEPRDVEVAVTAGAQQARTRLRLVPERRWNVYVAPSSHTDIGYTDLQENAVALHLRNTVEALKAASSVPGYRWNLEVAYHADLLRSRRPDLAEALDRALASGRIGLQGLYLNMLTGLCSSEEMVRVLTPATTMRRLGRHVASTASLNDVPSAIGTMPTLLRHAGYRYFTDAVNEYRGPLFRHADPRMRQSPFWWEGPDGSRVLAIMTHGYAQASGIGLTGGISDVAHRLPGWLRGFDRPDYSGDAVLAYGGVSDNVAMSPDYAHVAREWNKLYAYPKIIVGSADAFFQRVEAKVGSRLPIFKGDFGSYWEDGAASSARETAIVRHARERLAGAQRLLTLHERPYPAEAIKDAWNAVLFYNEHTWGAWCSISAPDSEQTREQWARKSRFATDARMHADTVAAALGRPISVSGPTTVRVWNTLAARRDICASVRFAGEVPALRSCTVTDVRSGKPVACQVETHGGNRLVFTAPAVPGFGSAIYRVVPSAQDVPPLLSGSDAAGEWSTQDLSFRLDPRTGALTSLRTKSPDHEWVTQRDGFGANQFVYVTGGEGSAVINQNSPPANLTVLTHTHAQIRVVENGPVRAMLAIRRTGDGVPTVETHVVVRPGGRMEFRNVIHKDATTAKEAAYFAFPFAMDPAGMRAHVDVPMGIVEAERGQLPGACRDWYACQSFAAVSDARRTAILTTPHAPLVTFSDIFRGQWRGSLDLNGTVFAYVLNNYWDTNYCARQAGPLTFSLALDLRAGPFDPSTAWAIGQVAVADMCDPKAHSATSGLLDEGALVTNATGADDKGAAPIAVDGAEVVGVEADGTTVVVRLLNVTDEPRTARIVHTDGRALDAVRTDLVGQGARRIPPDAEGAVSLLIAPHAPATVRLKMGRPGSVGGPDRARLRLARDQDIAR